MHYFITKHFPNSYNILQKELGLIIYWYKYAYINLFSTVGAHIGHSIRNTIRQASWLIYGYKWDLTIINLALTMKFIKTAFILATLCVSKFRPFWFVTQDKSFYRYSRFLSVKCGDFLVLYIESVAWRLIIIWLRKLIFLKNLNIFLCVKIICKI